ncbi:MAG: 50S ribosomal protein L1 [Microgenomates bacterium OLB22]|nr:MAG: 50S ribosomal protein L1 [Microgenomates bacterium OLB22]
MGKIRIKTIGIAEIESEEKKAAEKRQESKRSKKGVDLVSSQETNPMTNTSGDDQQSEKSVSPKSRKKTHQGKAYKKSLAQRSSDLLPIEKAVAEIKKLTYAKFDQTIELHISVQETGVKGELSLPHGTGKSVRVAIVDDTLLASLDAGTIEFDVLIARPADMPKLAKYAKVLGPRGLMPNPKLGTISDSPEQVVKKFSGGTIRYKTEPKFPLIHLAVGKASFEDAHLVENIKEAVKTIGAASISSAYLAASMTPSVKLILE